jgi:hypothetical protein
VRPAPEQQQEQEEQQAADAATVHAEKQNKHPAMVQGWCRACGGRQQQQQECVTAQTRKQTSLVQ